MMKRPIPSRPWWLLGGSRKEKESKALLKFPTNNIISQTHKRNELELETFADNGPEWSVGWTEPHAPDFQTHHDDAGFLVLVPSYKVSSHNNQLPKGLSPDGKNYMEQWLSSLQNL